MASPAPSTSRRAPVVGAVLLVLGLALGGATVVAQSSDRSEGGPAASFLAELLGPDESFAPVELELTGTLPRTATFQGVELSVDRVHLTNTHPYSIFGEPRPGELYYVVVELTARNPTETVNDYGFGDETFDLRTWSGRLLADVPAPGTYAFRRLEPGEEKTDELVFGSETSDVLDGAALLVGRPPDAPLVIPLTAPALAADYPTPVTPAASGPFQAAAVAWSVLGGAASLDRPPDVCCPDTGSRADDGELFVTLQLSGRVTGSQYGQATVSTDAVRLVVDGQPEPPIEFAGRPNTPEGEAFDFAATWVVRESDPGLALQFLDGPDVAEVVPVGIGPDAPVVAAAARSAPSMVPSAALSPVPSSAAAATTSSASAAPTAAAAPTPRPVLAAITTLLMYSGVPDPGWPLMTDDLAQLEAIAAGLETVEQAVPEGGLGYRGFRVTGPQGAWRANEGFVMAPSSAPGTALADPDRLVERFLLERGLPELTPEELAIAQEAIGSPLPAGSTAPRPTDG